MTSNDRKRTSPTPAKARVRGSASARISRSGAVRAMSNNGSGTRRTRSSAGHAARNRARSGAISRKEVAPVRRGKYRVIFERDESGAWLARVPSVRGCHTYGRTLDQARRRIREALSLWVNDAASAVLVEDVRLPVRAGEAIRVSRQKRARAEATHDEAQASTAQA